MRIRAVGTLVGCAVLALASTGCKNCINSPTPQKYAVLVSTEQATAPLVANNSEFWSDLVMTYRTLVQYGFDEDRIFVLYGDGKDFCSSSTTSSTLPNDYRSVYCNSQTKITDFPLIPPGPTATAAKNNICHVLCCLAAGVPSKTPTAPGPWTCECLPAGSTSTAFSCAGSNPTLPHLKANDFLFVWVKGHAAHIGSDTWLQVGSDYLGDTEIQSLLAKLAPTRRVVAMETCYSSGWLDQLKALDTTTGSGTATVAMSASGGGLGCSGGVGGEMSYPMWYPELDKTPSLTPASFDVVHGRFSLWLSASLRQSKSDGTFLASDTDANNLISIEEAFSTVENEMNNENNQMDALAQAQRTVCEPSPMMSCKQTPEICDAQNVAALIFMMLSP